MDSKATQHDVELTRKALDLAAAGAGLVSPNPLVGCVIANDDGLVLGQGTYLKENLVHAEVIALEQAGPQARGATAYVSLEPHDHHGKTPPCTEALISAGIKRVVCPIMDPNPLVSGRGFDRLRGAGIEVVTGILADEATRLNEKFICWHRNRRPFVHLKLALSLDGRISLRDSVSTALSGASALARVHDLRHEHDAILVGANTALVDDPSLTDRSGRQRRRPLVRVVLDNRLSLPLTSKLVTTSRQTPTVVFTNFIDPKVAGPLTDQGVQVVPIEGGARNLHKVLSELYDMEVQSVLVEGGARVAGAFVDAGLVDKITLIYAPLIIGGGFAPVAVEGKGALDLNSALKLQGLQIAVLGGDVEITGYPLNRPE